MAIATPEAPLPRPPAAPARRWFVGTVGIAVAILVAIGAFNVSPDAQGGIRIFDDITARTMGLNPDDANNLSWGSDVTSIFSTGELSDNISVLSVNASGVSLEKSLPVIVGDTRVHFDPGTKLIYTETGQAVDPATGNPIGNFNVSGPMVPESTLNRAFFVVGADSGLMVESFDLSTFALISSIAIPNGSGNPIRIVRWGQSGLAFNTTGGQIVLIGGNFVH